MENKSNLISHLKGLLIVSWLQIINRKILLLIVLSVLLYLTMLAIYFIVMYKNNAVISLDSQDWSNLGSYIGGFVTPIVTLLAGYFVYMGFNANATQLRIQIMRESLDRYDIEVNNLLERPFFTRDGSEDYRDISTRALMQEITDRDEINNEKSGFINVIKPQILLRLTSISVLCFAIQNYMELLGEISTSNYYDSVLKKANLCHVEHLYWMMKYQIVTNQMIDIVGDSEFKEDAGSAQYDALKSIFPDTFLPM